MEMTDKLTEINTNTDESIKDYYTDVYNPWNTKEQLTIWNEVKTPVLKTWTIDTADITLEKVNNVYNLSVPNPDWEIFTLEIIWNWISNIKTFKIGFFNNTQLAYETLEAELISLLWIDYTVTYTTWTIFTIVRFDWLPITINRPNITKKLEIGTWNEHTKLDIIIDWTTYAFNWVTYPTKEDIFTYLNNNLSAYYTKAIDDDYLLVARQDEIAPVITSTTYDRYTYRLGYQNTDTPNSWQYLDYLTTTIWGNNWKNTKSYLAGRSYNWDIYASNLAWIEKTTTPIYSTNTPLPLSSSDYIWTTFKVKSKTKFTKVTKFSWCDWTKARLVYSWTTLEEVTFVWNDAIFSTELIEWNTYSILIWNNWSNYNWIYIQLNSAIDWFPTTYNNYVEIYHNPTYNNWSLRYIPNIESIWTIMNIADYWYTIYDLAINNTFWTYSYFSLRKPDYTQISISNLNHYTSISFADDTFGTSNVETNNLAILTVSTYTEIAITLTNTGFAYFIPTYSYPNNITMNAISSVWSSDWTYKYPNQSCNTKYWTTTAFIDNKIFQTDESNYWTILQVKRWWFIISWTTNTSNKLTYSCT